MSAWRRKAMECLPALRKEFQNSDITIYEVFTELLIAIQTAHQDLDALKLNQYYTFAEWCFNQNTKELWNAAAVSFYEHLGDDESTKYAFVKWVKKDIYYNIRPLLLRRCDEDYLTKIDEMYRKNG